MVVIFVWSVQSIIAQPLNPNKKLSQYTLDSWGNEQGLISGGVLSIIQSKEGYIWFGSFNGVYRFDGINFKQFNKNNTAAISNNGVLTLCEDSNGNIWAGSNGGGIFVIENDSVKNYTTADGLSSNVIRKLYTDYDGSILIGTSNGLTIFKDSVFTSLQIFSQDQDRSSSVSIEDIFRDSKGVLWVGTNKGLFQFIQEKFVYTPIVGKKSGDVMISCIIENSQDELLIGTHGQGVFVRNKGTFSSFNLPLGALRVSNLFVDSNGSLWISYENGVIRYHKGEFSKLPSKTGSSSPTEEVMEDSEGSIWFARYNDGIDRLRDGIFQNYTTNEGLSDNNIHGIFEDFDGSKWIATANGLDHFVNGEILKFRKDKPLSHLKVRDTYRDSKGVLWVATYSGLYSLINGKIRRYGTVDGLSNDLIRVVFEASDGLLWFGTRNALFVLKNEKFVKYTEDNGLNNSFILSIQERVPGELWIGTSGGGIEIFKDGQFTHITTKDGLPSNVVFQIYKDDENILWIATNNGLCRYDGNFYSGFSSDNGFLTTAIFQIIEDHKGYFWITSDLGIIKVKKDEINQNVSNSSFNIKEISYKQVDGLKRSECTGAARSILAKDGKIWFATLGGVAVVDVNDSIYNAIPPPIIIEQLVVDQQSYNVTSSNIINFKASSKNFEIKYTGLSFKIPQKVKFQYQLIGQDEDWIDADYRRVAYYSNLKPGEYTFQVKAMNNDKLWSTLPAKININIHPEFYQTTGFYIFSILLFLGLAYGTYQIRVKAIKKDRVRLEQIVKLRTREIQDQKEQIEKQHNKIEEQNDKLKQSNITLEETVELRTEELKSTNEKLIETNRELDLFIYKSAHDLQGPIARVLGLSQLGLTDTNPPSEKIYFEKLNDTALNMSNMLSRIIRIHEINAKEIMNEPVNISRLIEDIYKEHIVLNDFQKIQLQNSIEDSFKIDTDKELVKIVLENLIANACKFRLSETDSHLIKIDALETTDGIELIVCNKGRLIPEEMQDRIFDIFTVATATNSGKGLGLYVSKIIMNRLDGKIELLKSNMEGTIFKLTFKSNFAG